MPRKKEKPSLHSYFSDAAEDYSTKQWMARNQHKTTRRALELLLDPKLGMLQIPLDEASLITDVACGSGYSSDILAEMGFPFVGADLSFDMLRFAIDKGYPVVQCDMQCLPFRDETFAHGISISGLNFVAAGAKSKEESGRSYEGTATEFARILQGGGRYAIEFYPSDDRELELALKAFKHAGFRGFLVVDHPGLRKEQKFLALEKERRDTPA